MKTLVVALFVTVALASAATPQRYAYRRIKLPASLNATVDNGAIFNLGSIPVRLSYKEWSSILQLSSYFGNFVQRVNTTSKESYKLQYRFPANQDPTVIINTQYQPNNRNYDNIMKYTKMAGNSLLRIETAMASSLLTVGMPSPSLR